MDTQCLEQGQIAQAHLLTGGTQNILLRFCRGSRDFVLRRPSRHPRPNNNDTIRREARILGALAGTGVPHPGLIAACTSEAVLGTAFYLMEPIDGFNATMGLPALHAGDPAMRREMGFAMVDAILALGRVDHVAVGLADFGKAEGYLERQVPRWRSQLETYRDLAGWPGPTDIPGIDVVADWLEVNRPRNFSPGIIHGDFHVSNVMFRYDSPNLAAIIDWELATIGDPLIDLGWMLATWPLPGQPVLENLRIEPDDGFPMIDELIARYAEGSTRDIAAIDWYVVLACYKLGIILEGTHARACAGKAPRETGDQLHALTISLFKRALSWLEKADSKFTAVAHTIPI
ncbi:phosphotransferase family protein [Noviherbaspirillum pedocola]|nr:phosphotransferase family protein [Noviherbaspirillum pedocola]